MPIDAAETAPRTPRAVVLGCAGEQLSAEERRFFAAADPLGFVLFRRNCKTPDQVRALVGEFREAVGRADAPVLIDQEGVIRATGLRGEGLSEKIGDLLKNLHKQAGSDR